MDYILQILKEKPLNYNNLRLIEYTPIKTNNDSLIIQRLWFSKQSDLVKETFLKEIPDWKLKRKISDYCYDLDLKYETFLDIHILGEEELNTLRGKQPIFQTALEKGIRA